MTVASLMFATSFPIAFTDHLVSNSVGTPTPPVTPISGVETRKGVNGDIPVGLGLKLWESKADIYLLYAGSIHDANQILGLIELALQQQDYCGKINQQIEDSVERLGLNASYIVVYLSRRDRVSFYHSKQARSFIGEYFRRVVMIGSGKQTLEQVINKVSSHLTVPVPDIKTDLTGHVFQSIASALQVVAHSTLDYMNDQKSSFADHSTGGYFCISYFLNLYWREKQPPAFLENSLCQIFTECDKRQAYLTRLIVSQRLPGLDYMDVYVFEGRHPLTLKESVIDLALQGFSHSRIANIRRNSTHGPMSPLAQRLDFFQVITYASLALNGGQARTHTVEFSGAVAVDLNNTPQAIQLTLHRPILKTLWARLLTACQP